MSKVLKHHYGDTIYKALRICSTSAFSYNWFLSHYGVSVDFLKDKKCSVDIGFNVDMNEKIVNSFLKCGWNLISVSEDAKSITYHFTKKINIC